MKQRKVLIDLRYLNYLYCGFGQLSLSYAQFLADTPQLYSDLDITLLVPKKYVGKFGNKLKYLRLKKIYKFVPCLFPFFDISHSITQQIKYTSLSDKSVRILTIHDLNFLYERENEKKRLRKKKQLGARIKLADYITVISEFTKIDLLKNININPNTPVDVIYNGLKNITKDKDQKPEFVKAERKFFTAISSIEKKKNFHVLIDMMKYFPDYDLYICGNNKSDYAKEIKHRIEQANIRNIFMPGVISHEEKVWLYKNNEAFLFPSLYEGFGMPVIEAMSMGKPVFSSQETSLKEIGNKYAFFWEHFEASYMAQIVKEGLSKFYFDPYFATNQIAYASSYSLENNMKQFLELYRTIPLPKRNFRKLLSNYWNFSKA